jgi:chromosome segregation ATPase
MRQRQFSSAMDLLIAHINRLETRIMALADTIAQLQAEDTELAADVANAVTALNAQAAQIAALQTQISQLEAGGTISADQLAALQSVADDLTKDHTTIAAALPAAPTA